MAINLCVAHHSARISCNKVSADGYEAANLVSSDENCKKRGFLAASFITPPVDIIVTFPYLIDISHVVVRLNNGSQRTCALKLYTCTSEDENGTFHLIGGKDNVTESEIFFYNNRYRETCLFSTFTHKLPRNERLYPRQDYYVCSIQSLKVALLRTAKSTVPALSKLEVWGQPATSCSEKVKLAVFQKEFSARSSLHHLPEQSRSQNNDSKKESPITTDEVPTEFFDSITCEIMAQPVLLPSGNNVDNLTLEKYIETSSTWGRLPGDPFTGLAFSKTSQPVPNVELKSRIDQFWLTHPKLDTGGRCITFPKKLSFMNKSKMNLVSSTSKGSPLQPPNVSNSALHKPDINFEQRSMKRKPNCLEPPSNLKISVTKRSSKVKTSVEHERELADSLKISLQAVLSDRPSFISAVPTIDMAVPNICVMCSETLESLIYSMPCSHLLCRICLLKLTESETLSCNKCSRSFCSSDVKRYHEQ